MIMCCLVRAIAAVVISRGNPSKKLKGNHHAEASVIPFTLFLPRKE
jgi:hypothetical protein